MIAQLTDEQRKSLLAGVPLVIQDGPHTFYLICKEEYEAGRAALELGEIEPSFFEFDDDQDSHPAAVDDHQ